MKSVIIKLVVPPLLFLILYINLNFFIFSFGAREGYLNKRLNKIDKDTEELKQELEDLRKDKRIKQHDEISKRLKDLEKVLTDSESFFGAPVNIYKEFENNNLTLLSEKLVKSGVHQNSTLKKVTDFTVTGDYGNVIRILKTISESELIPVSFTLQASGKSKTKYTISVWNKNEQL